MEPTLLYILFTTSAGTKPSTFRKRLLNSTLRVLGGVNSALRVLDDLLQVLALHGRGLLDLLTHTLVLERAVVKEHTGSLCCADAEEEEVNRGKAGEC